MVEKGTDNLFKKCPMCKELWLTRTNFLQDSSLRLNGYQADFESVENGLFYFTHHVEGCFSTLAVYSAHFLDLYHGERFSERKTGSEECPGYCLKKEKLDRCDANCEYAFVREIIHIIRKYQSA